MKKVLLIFTLFICFFSFQKKSYAIFTSIIPASKISVLYSSGNTTISNDYACTNGFCSSGTFGQANGLSYLRLYLSPSELPHFQNLSFNVSITIYNDVNLATSSTNAPIPSSVSATGLVETSNNYNRIAVCDINSVAIPQYNTYQGQYTNASGQLVNRYSTTYNLTTHCYVDLAVVPSGSQTVYLEYLINTGNNNVLPLSLTQVDVIYNQTVVIYNGEYNSKLNQIIQLLQNSASGGVSSSDITQQTQDIIDNQNQNTQDIIDNQNDIYIQKDCTSTTCDNLFNMSSVNGLSARGITYSYNSADDTISSTGTYNLFTQPENVSTGYICSANQTLYISINHQLSNYLYFYLGDRAGTWSRINPGDTNLTVQCNAGEEIKIQLREATTNLQVMMSTESNQLYCKYGTTSQDCTDTNRLDNISNSINDLQNTITNQDNSQANSEFDSILNINIDDFGMSSFGNLSISYLQQLHNKVCSSWTLQVPYVRKNNSITIPCFSQYYQQHFAALLTIIHMIYRGLISYWCIIQVYRTIHKVLDVDSDEIYLFSL